MTDTPSSSNDLPVCVTGHRFLSHPEHLIHKRLGFIWNKLNPSIVLTGMAVGFDQLIAENCILNNIPFKACIPFEGQEVLWPEHIKLKYYYLLEKAQEIYLVSPPGYAAWKLLVRNKYMVDQSKAVVAYYDASKNTGGTKHCVEYSRGLKRPILNIWDLI